MVDYDRSGKDQDKDIRIEVTNYDGESRGYMEQNGRLIPMQMVTITSSKYLVDEFGIIHMKKSGNKDKAHCELEKAYLIVGEVKEKRSAEAIVVTDRLILSELENILDLRLKHRGLDFRRIAK